MSCNRINKNKLGLFFRFSANRLAMFIVAMLLVTQAGPLVAQSGFPCCDGDKKVAFEHVLKRHWGWVPVGHFGNFPNDLTVQVQTDKDDPYPWKHNPLVSIEHWSAQETPPEGPFDSDGESTIKIELWIDEINSTTVSSTEAPEEIEHQDEVKIKARFTNTSGSEIGPYTGTLFVNGQFRAAFTDDEFRVNDTFVIEDTFELLTEGTAGTDQFIPNIIGDYMVLELRALGRSGKPSDEYSDVLTIYKCSLEECPPPECCVVPDVDPPHCIPCEPCITGGTEIDGRPVEMARHATMTDFSLGSNPSGGCSSCSGGEGGSPSAVNLLSVGRRLIPANRVSIGNSSPGMFFEDFDMRLTLHVDPGDDHHALLFDPRTQKTISFRDDGGSGTYESQYQTYFYSLEVKDDSNQPATGPDDAETAYIISHDGWRYDFDIVGTELDTDLYGGRLSKITSPEGFEKTFTYKSFSQTLIDESPTRQFQIDTITDWAGNVAEITYNSSQQAGRWVISDININSDMVQLQYLYNSTSGNLETVKRMDDPATTWETIATYTYGIDEGWDAAYIQLDERLWESNQSKDRIFLSQDYTDYQEHMANQFANSLVGRADGDGEAYMVVHRSPTTPGLYRIQYRGTLAEYQAGQSYRYFSSWTSSGSGYNAYSGTLEDVFEIHPTADEDQIMQAIPPLVSDKTGFGYEAEYDSDLNIYRKIYERDGGGDPTDYEQFLYDSKNRETYRRDREGYVTLTERDSDGHIVRIANGFKDLDGDGTATAETGATQTIFGYYGTSHQNEGLLKWTTTNAYASGAVAEPSEDSRTDYVYNSSQELTEIIKPKPEGQTERPSVTFIWTNGLLYSTTDETENLTTTFTYDSIGRLIQTAYSGDSTNEQIWRDEDNDIVYRKDRNGVVSRTEYDDAGRVTKQIAAYGHDTNILDESIATVNSSALQSVTENFYAVGKVQPFRVRRNGVDTLSEYDYRGRVSVTEQMTAGTSNNLKSTRTFVDNMLFSESEIANNSYTRTTYNGYSTDRLMVRKIMTRDPTVTFADNAAVLAATRATGTDTAHVIADAVRDLRGNLVEVIDGYGTTTLNTFDALGRQTQSVQAHGTSMALTITTVYDGYGRVWKTTDPAGMVTETQYDDAGNVTSRTIAFDTADELTTTSDLYDPKGRLVQTTSPSGAETTNFYDDCCGNITGTSNHYGLGSIQIADAGGRTVYQASVNNEFDFEADDYTDPDAAATTSETTSRYFDDGRVQFTTRWKSARGAIDPQDPPIAGMDSVSVSDGLTTQYVYFSGISDSASRLINRLGGGTTTIDIDEAIDQLALAPSSGGASVTFASGSGDYALGRATVAIAPDEKTMQVAITDGAGRSVMNAVMSGPAATTPYELLDWHCTQYDQTYSLSSFGTTSRTNQVDPDGEMVSSMTDGFGWNVASMDEDSNLSRNKYDSGGNVKDQIDPLTHSVTHVYDALGRRTSTTTYAGTTSTEYNESTGRIDSQTDAKDNETIFEYDILGRVTTVTDRLDQETVRTYDSAGLLYTLTDAEDKTTTYTYDVLGRKLTTTYPDDSVTTIDYDPSGTFPTGSTAQKLTYESGKNKTSINSFDGTLDKIEYRNSGGTLIGTDDFSYDSMLRQSGSTSMDGVTRAMTYTDRGQLASEATTYGSQTYTVSYTYNARGRVEEITYPSGRDVAYAYTTRGELDTIDWDTSQFEDRAYDAAGRLTSIDRPYTDETRTYDNANRLLTIGNTDVGTMTYTWDDNSNKLSETWSGDMADWSFTTEKTGVSYPEGYDEEDRLRRFIQSGQSQDIYLARSDIGNISDVEINSGSNTRGYSDAHELTTMWGSPIQTFDDDGNLTTHNTGLTLGWDVANRLTQTVMYADPPFTDGSTNDYGYDAEGQRTWMKVTVDTTVTENTVYIYAGPNCVAEYNYGGAASAPVMEYIYADEIDSLAMIARNNNAENLIVTRNQQWSVVSLCDDDNGDVLERYSYDQFGKRTILAGDGTTYRTSSSYDNPYGYTSRRHCDEAGYEPVYGLMYFRARYYDVTTGEFTSRDPLEYVDGMSLMRGYLGLNKIDPLGLVCQQAKVCDVSSFVVTYEFKRQFTKGEDGEIDGTTLFVLRTDITFKKDNLHDPALCQFRQFVSKSHEFKAVVGQNKDQTYVWKTFFAWDGTWVDDDYSRPDDDQDGKPEMPQETFVTHDGPGVGGIEINDKTYIYYKIALQQAVYDTQRKEWVWATPPVTIEVEGIDPRKYTVSPDEDFNWNANKDGGTVQGKKGEPVMGTYK